MLPSPEVEIVSPPSQIASSDATACTNSSAQSLKEAMKPPNSQTSSADSEHEVQQLARELTSRSDTPSHTQNPFEANDGGPLDPHGSGFKAKAWAKAFYNLRAGLTDGNSSKVAGISFKKLHVFGYGSPTDYQKSIANIFLKALDVIRVVTGTGKQKITILQDLNGLVRSGEMIAVLGPPGSGCSTLLKTIAGDTYGFEVGPGSNINYQGIPPEQMRTRYRGEAIYTAEVDAHFPMLSVGDTLYFAAMARSPYHLPGDIRRQDYATHLRDVTMAMFGIAHTANTRVGNNFVRGVSGGERKRVTIAEAALSYSPLQCWDNSTRGLDSANAIEFCKTLRTQSDVFGSTSCVAIYQAPQAAYDVSIIPPISPASRCNSN